MAVSAKEQREDNQDGKALKVQGSVHRKLEVDEIDLLFMSFSFSKPLNSVHLLSLNSPGFPRHSMTVSGR